MRTITDACIQTQGADEITAARVPLQRQGDTGDVANMVVFLFSDAANYISGGKFVRISFFSRASLASERVVHTTRAKHRDLSSEYSVLSANA